MVDLAAVLEQARQANANQDRLRAYSLYVQATQLDTKSTAAWAGRAATASDLDDAITSLGNVLALIPHDPFAREMLMQRVQERIAQSTSSDVKDLVAMGRGLAQVQEKSLAHQLFVRATQLDERYETGWLWRGSSTEDLDEALMCFDQALAINPGNRAALEARHLLNRRKSQASQQAFEPARSFKAPAEPATESTAPVQPPVPEPTPTEAPGLIQPTEPTPAEAPALIQQPGSTPAEAPALIQQPGSTPTQDIASIQMPAVEPIRAPTPTAQTLPQIPTPATIESAPVRPIQTESAPSPVHPSAQTLTVATTRAQQPTAGASPSTSTPVLASLAPAPAPAPPKRVFRPPAPTPPPVILPIEEEEPTNWTHLIMLIISLVLLILLIVNYLQKSGYLQ